MESINYIAAWVGITCGFVSGLVMGLMFQKETWLGGYSTWARRLVRLGHISFFGIGFINLSYAVSLRFQNIQEPSPWTALLLIIGAITMPLVCYLAAWRQPLRHLFPIPALSLMIAVVMFLFKGGVL